MKTAIYPGSFNPWHEGHQDILEKSLQIFDRVLLARGQNPDKKVPTTPWSEAKIPDRLAQRVVFIEFKGFLHKWIAENAAYEVCAVIRGLRNGYDLQAEINQQYWYEDLGLKIPLVYFVTDRKFGHISSSAIRAIAAIQNIEIGAKAQT